MEGPTPVSALIHAATMVTAGVYMIGRMNGLFAMAPDTMMVIAIVGAATAIFAASIGLAQNDIKRVLAYSTVSQLGYMFLAMGVGAFTAGVFHLMTHAFFKACLFLGSGSVIHALSGEQDMRYMGGLRKHMPYTHITFLIATIAIAGIPGLSAFFSKDEILWWAFASNRGSWILWLVGAAAAGMTAFYMFRLVFMTFYGKERITDHARHHLHESPFVITLPLMILAVLSIVGGYIGIPAILGGANHIHHFLEPVFGGSLENYGIATGHYSHALEYGMMGISIGIAVVGIALAYIMYLKKPELPGKFVASFQGLHRAVFNKWYMDEIYDTLFVNPTKRLGTFLWKGFDVVVVDGIVNGFGKVVNACSKGLRFTQSGFVHNYALSMVIGVLVIVGIYVLR
jgi:NADH-quinone oxidoreductase subunit L